MRTRIAPTPSGYLHVGNAVHASVVAMLARRWGAEIALRIDDVDAGRARTEYVEDIFATLHWLGIEWSLGPTSAGEEFAALGTGLRHRRLREALDQALDRGLPAYACTCSRREAPGILTGGCPGACRQRDVSWTPGVQALRVHVPPGTHVNVGAVSVDLAGAMGDFVIWRRDDVPSYQLESVVADGDLACDLIIRGEDLLASSAAQVYACAWLGVPQLREARFVHHPLVLDAQGAKLSKSAGHGSAPLPRDEALLRYVLERATRVAQAYA